MTNVITYNALISVCGKGGQTYKALEFFAEMVKRGLEPDVITYISVCEKGSQTDKALEFYAVIKKQGLEPSSIHTVR